MLVVVAACLVALLAGAIVLLVRHRGGKDRLLALALNNMSQGVVMSDATGISLSATNANWKSTDCRRIP
jgi:hypothetical protein